MPAIPRPTKEALLPSTVKLLKCVHSSEIFFILLFPAQYPMASIFLMNEPKNHLENSKQALNYLFQQDIIFKTYLVYGFLLKMSPLDPAHHPMLSLFPQSCLTLCNPMDYSPPGSSIMEFSRQEYWSG